MSNKIRLTGLIVTAVVLIVGIIGMSVAASANIGEVDSLETGSVAENSAELQWKKVGSADGYFIYQKSDGDFERVATVDDSQNVRYTAENLEQATPYTFYVNAFKNHRKKTVESKKHTEVSLCTMPKTPELSAAPVAVGTVELSWEVNDKAAGYKVEYSQSEDFADSKESVIDDPTLDKTEIADLEVGSDYYFRATTFIKYNDMDIYSAPSETVKCTAPSEESLEEVDPNKPMIAVTFDDGPGYNSASERILDVIEKYHIRATFFMVGKNAESNPDNIKRKAQLKCEIGNHTYDHSKYGKKVTAADIKNASDAISKAGDGVKVTCFRSPGGNTTPTIRKECEAEGMPLYYWSLDTLDWKTRDAKKVYDTVMNNVSDGDIILMHEIYESTADAFEKMVPELIKQGYQFVTCDELVKAKTGSAPTAGTQYVDGKTVNNETC